MPLISVLMPAWNAADTIRASLESIRRQTCSDWECVIVDDGSTDATVECAAAFADADPRFRLLRRRHEGIVAALLAGLDACRGELVARMDADDLMRRDRLERQAALLRSDAGLAAVGGGVRFWPRAGLGPGLRDYETWLNGLTTPAAIARDAFVECPVAHPALMVRRNVLAATPYQDRGWPEDYDLILRLLASNARIGAVPGRVIAWRDRPSRLSRSDVRYGLDRFTACKAFYLAATFLAATDAYVLWGHGATGSALRHALARHGKHPSHIIEIAPGRLGQRIGGAPVVGPDRLPALRGARIVVSVARAGPRGEVRDALAREGFVELRDFVCAA